MPISGPEIDDWIDEMSALATRFVAGFEAAYGYVPGGNYVSRATGDGGDALAGALGDGSARDLVEFYARVEEVCLADVGSGYFVHPVDHVVHGMLGDAKPTRVVSTRNREIVAFGSDGGGALFAADRRTEEIIRLGAGILLGDVYEVDDLLVDVIAEDFPGFLRFLHDELLRHMP
ncbi:hypothetical protein AB0I81_52430 [Nonomuraea sp. NPDC050404]|uniref:hypothetical protein n=1 Tax=Nonomuraea sp. NPDC050404 TaxID=3155783 RepID=UPI0033E017C5